MISKVEAVQRLKKMGIIVADDHSIVTILLPAEVSFDTGLKDVRQKLAEIGYDASFCVKQSNEKTLNTTKGTSVSNAKEESIETEKDSLGEVTKEELSSYMAIDADGQFSLDDDGQFTLGLEF